MNVLVIFIRCFLMQMGSLVVLPSHSVDYDQFFHTTDFSIEGQESAQYCLWFYNLPKSKDAISDESALPKPYLATLIAVMFFICNPRQGTITGTISQDNCTLCNKRGVIHRSLFIPHIERDEVQGCNGHKEVFLNINLY